MADKFTFSAGTNLPEIAEEVASEIAFITRSLSPLLVELGFPGDLDQVGSTKHDWQEDALLPNSGTIDAGGGLAPGVTALVFDTPQGLNFLIGDELQVEGSTEIMVVVAPAPTATVVNVTRGAKGTVAITIPDNSLVKRISNPAVENETAPAARPTNRSRLSNYTQIFRNTASVTRSMQNVTLLGGIADEMEHQVDRVIKDLVRDLAHSVVRGKAQTVNPEGTAAIPRTMNGIIQSILAGANPSVQDAGGAGLDESRLNLLMEDMWTKGGTPRLLAAPPAQRRRLSALLQGRQRYRVEDSTLGAVVERFVSDFGEIDVLAADIFIPSNVVLVLDPAKIRMVKLGGGDPFEVMPLAQLGLSMQREVVTEVGIEIENAGDGGQGMITNLATA
jgi:hypothetical protein